MRGKLHLERSSLLALLASVVLISSGCISPPEKTPQNISTLRIGYQPSTHQVAEMVAMDLGWWSKDLEPLGIKEIREFGFPSGNSEMQAMMKGELDVAYVGTSPPIAAISQGLDARIVAAVNINGSDLVLRSGVPYNGPQSLTNMSIATFPPGTVQDIVLKKWLQENDVKLSQVNISPMGPGDAIIALASGKVDGVFTPHPSPAIIEIAHKGRSVVASGEMWPNHACCSLVVSSRLIMDHPEIVEQIVRTHINATEYANSNPDEAAQIYANHTGQNLDMVRHSLKTWDGKWISDPHLEIPSTMEYTKIHHRLNYTSKEISAQNLFDTTFFDEVR